jgi:hypothetical protein
MSVDTIVRLKKITINNLKNVENGSVCLNSSSYAARGAEVLGIYGQNGSGKTALIDSLSLLRLLLSGSSIPAKYVNFISSGTDVCSLSYEFAIKDRDIPEYTAEYTANLRIIDNNKSDEILLSTNPQNSRTIVVENEKLSASINNDKTKAKKSVIMNTSSEKCVFEPKSKLDSVTNKNSDVLNDLIVVKKMSAKEAKSFIFSENAIDIIAKAKGYQWDVMKILSRYGIGKLYILDASGSNIVGINGVGNSWFKNAACSISFIIASASIVDNMPLDIYKYTKDGVGSINDVLTQIIPGLTLELTEARESLDKDGKQVCGYDLLSVRNGKKIPFRYESTGIKKIAASLIMLISAYNDPSVTLAIDELDSGVFEYLLGEILKIFVESGKGQLIFTSHNLRPLEVLDKKSVCFTTVNPKQRFVKMTNVNANNNLRDFYYRDIVLGGQPETLYDSTNSYKMALAFMTAGETGVENEEN